MENSELKGNIELQLLMGNIEQVTDELYRTTVTNG